MMKKIIFYFIAFASCGIQSQMLDTSFNDSGQVFPPPPTANDTYENIRFITKQSDGKILLLSDRLEFYAMRVTLTRYNINGSTDTAFGENGKIIIPAGNPEGLTILQTNEGKLLAAWGDGPGLYLRRYNLDGSLDTTFDGDGMKLITYPVQEGPSGMTFKKPKLTSDNKIIAICHKWVIENNPATPQLYNRKTIVAKIDLEGNPDTSFNDTGFWAMVHINEPQEREVVQFFISAGKLLIWHNGGKVIRLDYESGKPDLTLNGNGVIYLSDTYFKDICLLNDGKYLMSQGGAATNWIKKFNADFSPDISFGDNGKLLVPMEVNDFLQQPNDKIILVGKPQYPDNQFKFLRLDTNGVLDTSNGTGILQLGIGPFGLSPAQKVILMNNGMAVIAGNYKFREAEYNTYEMAIYMAAVTSDMFLNTVLSANEKFSLYPNPFTDNILLSHIPHKVPSEIRLFNLQGRLIHIFTQNEIANLGLSEKQIYFPSQIMKGSYILKISWFPGQSQSFKIIKN